MSHARSAITTYLHGDVGALGGAYLRRRVLTLSALIKAGAELRGISAPIPMWLVPIRYWETQEPIRCDFLRDTRTPEDHPEAGTSYVFHHGYRHNVYVHPANLFDTPEEARTEALRRKEVKEREDEAAVDRLMAIIFPGHPNS